MTLPEANFRYTKNFRLRRQHQQLKQQPKQQPKQQQNQQQNQQQHQRPKQQQILIEFGPPAQIYGVGLSILMVFGHQKIIMMGFIVCVCVCLRCFFVDLARSQF